MTNASDNVAAARELAEHVKSRIGPMHAWADIYDALDGLVALAALAAPVGEAVATAHVMQVQIGPEEGYTRVEIEQHADIPDGASLYLASPQPTAAAPEAKPRNLYSEGYYQGRADAAAAPDVLAMREALRHARSVIESGVDSDYGRKWIWPDSAHKTIIRESKEALAQIDAALSAQGEAKPEPRAAWFDVEDEVTITRAVSVLEDVLTDIDDWEDKALAEAVRESMRDLRAMVGTIGMAAASVATPEPQEGRSIQDLQREIGQLQQELVLRVCGDPTKGIGFNIVTGTITQDGERDHG